MHSRAPKIPRNAALLIALLILIVVAPLLPIDRSWFLIELMFDLILVAGVYSIGSFESRWAFLLLTAVTLSVRWAELLSGMRGMDVTALSLTVMWLAFAVTLIVYHLFRHRDVDFDTIVGAIVTYLLAAVAFAILFQMLALVRPGAFSGLADDIHADRFELSNAMMYYSFVCITTMGYGDIVPVGPLARPLSVLEGVFGQLYLAVMIARLVGLHIAHSSSKPD
jgi:hypothetical protein